MRGVGVRGSLLASVAAAAILLSVQGPVTVAAAEPPSPEAAAAAPPKDDYYTRRAKRILKAEREKGLKPHPMAASFPGMDVVVCEAGCPDSRGPEVVFLRRHVVTTETREGMMMPTSGSDDAFSATFSPYRVACVAGCYGERAGPSLRSFARRPAIPSRMALPPRDKLSPVR